MSDITRKEHINRLKAMQDCIKHCVDPNYQCDDCDNCEINYMKGNLGEIKETMAYVIASLETDEAYDLMYEQPEFCKDCISRADVINIIQDMHGLARADVISDAVNKIISMPSVLPKTDKDNLGVDYLGVDCIDRQATLGAIIKRLGIRNESYLLPAERTIYQQIKDMPSVTPQPRKGHWIGHREHCENLGVMPSGLGAYEWCSNCDCGIDVREWHRNHYNYCPNCGAKMESEDNK